MVARNFYDVIVIGTQLGPLLTAALLARRGFRVLVLAHDDLPATYAWGEHKLQQEPFMLSGADFPAIRRVLSELSLTQIFRRRTTPHDPFYQVVLPRHRFDVTGDAERFAMEMEREFPDARRAIDAFYGVVDRAGPELDKLLGADMVLPPDGFFERRDLARAAAHDPFAPTPRARVAAPLFGDLPDHHPFRVAVRAQVRWASDLETAEPGPLPTVRLHTSWARGTLAVEGGLEGLKEMVLDRIITHSGDLRRDLVADRIAIRRGRVAGVRMEGQEEVTGCNFVVFGADAHHLPRMVDVGELGPAFAERLQDVQPAFMRYTVNLIVDSAVLPEGMARNVLFIPEPGAELSGDNLLRIEVTGAAGQATRTLCIGALLPADRVEDLAYVEGMRGRVVDRLRWLVPFLERHLVAVDSPHDGRKLQDLRSGREVTIKDKWARHPGRMPTVSRVGVPGPLDVTGLPHRTGLKNLVLACRQVVPGLGLEGEFLTAWGAASIITRADRRKLRFRKQAWTKIDL